MTLGSINMAIAICLGAFGAHGLKTKVSKTMLENWNTGTLYHLIHAVALLCIGLLISRIGNQGSWIHIAGWLIIVGIILFSGSLYTMVLTNMKSLGAITPIGGLSFIIAWILVTITSWRLLD